MSKSNDINKLFNKIDILSKDKNFKLRERFIFMDILDIKKKTTLKKFKI